MILATAGLSLKLVPLLAALTVITGAGSLVARMLRPGVSGGINGQGGLSASCSAWGWSFLLGFAGVGIILQFPLAIYGRITHRSFSTVLAFCSCMTALEILLRWRNLGQQEHSDPRRIGMLNWIGDLPLLLRMLTILCLTVFTWFSAIESPANFDSRSIYGLKARILYDVGDLRGEDFRDPDRLHFNANYPLLVPLLVATLYSAQGSAHDLGIQLMFGGFVLAGASIFVAEIRRFEPRAAAAVWGACYILLPVALMPSEGGGLSGSADFIMAVFATAAVIAAGHWLTSPRIGNAVLTGSMLGAAIITKQEGLIWFAALAAALAGTVFLRRNRPDWRQLGTVTCAAGIAVGCLLLSAITARGIPSSPYVRPFTGAVRLDWIVHTWTRIGFIARFAVLKLGSVPLFGFVWPFVAVVLLALRRSKSASEVQSWRAAVGLTAAAYLVVFMITPLHLEYQLRTAFYRLAIHVLPLFMLVAAEQLAASGWSHQLRWIWSGKRETVESETRSPVIPSPHFGIHCRSASESGDEKIEFSNALRRAA